MPGQAFAYLRVCKEDQDLEKNKADILKLANDAHLGHVQFIEEKIGGSISWRKRQIATVRRILSRGTPLLSVSCPAWAAVCWSAWKSSR